MGRGQQMSMYDVEKSIPGGGLRSMTKRRVVVVALVSFFLPFVITSTYLYYTTPDAATEAMLFLQRRPFSGFSPSLTEDTNASSIINDTTGSDTSITDSLDAKQAEVDAEDTDPEAKELDPSETTSSANETSAALESSLQEEATNSTSEILPLLTMGLSNTTNSTKKEACDLVKGSWVPDSRPPQYTNSTCGFIQGHQNCMKNGRKDRGFLHWKWKPDQCELPRIDPQSFLAAMRDRSMAFAGDSIARNQFQSLLCVLSQVEQPDHTYNAPDDRDNVWVFRKHNFTLAIYWSPYLVHVEDKEITFSSDNQTRTVAFIHVDRLDKAWVDRIPGVDILQLSTGQWWFKRGLFLQEGKPLGGHICDGWAECEKEIGFADPYRTTIRTILRGSLSIPGYSGTTILRTFAPEHFEGGSWNNGGQCVRTAPGGVPVSSLTKWMYDIQMEEFLNVTSATSGSEKDRIKVLDITNLAQIRADGHPNSFMRFQPFAKEFTQKIQNDCLHWCLPGPIDTWNDLLVESLRDAVYKQ
ncbi:hypothetical protein M758_5G078500 [Ceratodon purpureus]|nr:hypothetical protein M758_5G078500 [Ceratodon purpureus]KAG0615946.1 hypothetical protein M758_5G078500 [Ceratodon purpureus]KAG0615947.1 hypothetical protein M758_5G078500 [Ceratodon purpureus]